MFAATKVKLHGMQDERWTTKDKLIQYRGLISLYMRDRKIIEYDKVNAAKKHVKDLKRLHKEIYAERQNLDNAINGDRQKVRNTLAEDRSLQLAYQHLHPTKIVDQIYQENFNKRKELDRILYKQKAKTKELIALKLELAELQDRLTYEGPGKIQIEIEAGIITGQVQQAILKKEAAITVQQTYINIINIMKKDRIYYDAVLNSLRQDCESQGICLLHTTQMGQLATEYLDDRRQEYKNLEQQVRVNMKERLSHLEEVNIQVEHMVKNVKNLIRRDSDVDVIRHVTGNTTTDDQLQCEIKYTTDLLEKLRSATVVSTFDAIYPCMVVQRTQVERLTELYERNLHDRDRLRNKESHARLMLDQITQTMVETTMEYKQEKADLLRKIREQLELRRKQLEMVRQRGELTVNIRRSLQQLYTITMPVVVGGEHRRDATEQNPKFETDAIKLIEILARRLHVLAGIPIVNLTHQMQQEAEEFFQHLVTYNIGALTQQQDLNENEFLEGLVFEDAQLPTREYIKLQSKEIVEHNMQLQIIDANTVLTSEKSLKAYKKARSKRR